MKINTLSIVCGTTACNAKCPFCVSKTTPTNELNDTQTINFRNLNIACRLAKMASATTCLITGKGEPTLYPKLIGKYIAAVQDYFPFIELQTNGILLNQLDKKEYLQYWFNGGLTTVSISAVHFNHEFNQKIYGENYRKLEDNIQLLHSHGFSVRLSIMILKDYGLDNDWGLRDLLIWAKNNKVEQLTVRHITSGDYSSDTKAWINEHASTFDLKKAVEALRGHVVLHLPWGAIVYDVCGQNICVANCLTTNDTPENMRQIIFYPNGTIGYDWKYSGAILL